MKRLLLLLIVGWTTVSLQAQVAVGVDEDAVPGAIMQWKEVANVEYGTHHTACKGLAFPRVALSVTDRLYPMFLAEPADPNCNIPAPVYDSPDKREDLNWKYIGLVVYNVTDKPEIKLYPGLAVWNGSQWVSLAQTSSAGNDRLGTCEMKPGESCLVNGTYVDGQDLDDTHTIKLTVTVNDIGKYFIHTSEVSGISFSAEGSFAATGTQDVILKGTGKLIVDPPATKEIFFSIYFYSEAGIAVLEDIITVRID